LFSYAHKHLHLHLRVCTPVIRRPTDCLRISLQPSHCGMRQLIQLLHPLSANP
jgi:hypothetical protein